MSTYNASWWRSDVPMLDAVAGPEVWAEYEAHDARTDVFLWGRWVAPLLWLRHDMQLRRIPGPLADV